MAIELTVNKFPYTITGVPVYETLQATRSSYERMSHLSAFESGLKRGVPLQSLGDCFILRYAFDKRYLKDGLGIDHSHEYQVLSTVVLSFRDQKGRWKSGVVELPNDKRSLALVRDWYDTHSVGQELLKPCSDAFIDGLVQTAARDKRVVPVLKKNSFEFSVKEKKSGSAYSMNPRVITLAGHPKIAEVHAAYLRSNGYDSGPLWDITEDELVSRCPKDMVLCRPVGLDGTEYSGPDNYEYYNDIIIVNADDNYYNCGWARWVVHDVPKIPRVSK
ncbi:MAG: hypothetical protein HY363_05740 [Candidatus Aenigmarchaeota archaeon]|nr:hypothetical protein [Candidatus Aenigmarchaeota archaeon]